MESNDFNRPGDPDELETGLSFTPRFNKDGLLPCVTIDHASGSVLMHAWMNREALARTLATRQATYFSRSRNSIWVKGETSGRVQHVVEIRVDCDQDTLQLRVRPERPGACHRGYESCFYRKVNLDDPDRLIYIDISPVFDPDRVYGSG